MNELLCKFTTLGSRRVTILNGLNDSFNRLNSRLRKLLRARLIPESLVVLRQFCFRGTSKSFSSHRMKLIFERDASSLAPIEWKFIGKQVERYDAAVRATFAQVILSFDTPPIPTRIESPLPMVEDQKRTESQKQRPLARMGHKPC